MNSIKSLGFIVALSFLVAIPSQANITVNPSAVMFGSVKMGMSGFRMVSVINNSSEAVNVQVSMGCPMGINVNSGCYMLNAYGSCSINISYRPIRPVYDFCDINVRDSKGSLSFVHISGNGIR